MGASVLDAEQRTDSKFIIRHTIWIRLEDFWFWITSSLSADPVTMRRMVIVMDASISMN